MRPRTLTALAILQSILAAAPVGAAELYKWVDERGVTNYSNEPPAKARNAKKLPVDEGISVYTPDAHLTQALEAERKRRGAPAPSASLTLPPQSQQQRPPPPPTTSSTDPCLTGGNPNCYATTPYDASPIFSRSRPPVLLQPQLPPGTIAGNANLMNGVTPGLSGVTPPAAPVSRASRPGASFTKEGAAR